MRRSNLSPCVSSRRLFGVENSIKALKGNVAALQDPEVFTAKVAGEKELRAKVDGDPALLTVDCPPSITTQPEGQRVAVGQSVSFNVTASGTAPLCYCWYFNDSPIAAATNSVLTLSSISSNQAGDYSVRVSDDQGIAGSAAATLVVVPARPFSNGSFEFATVPSSVSYLELANGDTRLLAWSIGGAGAPLDTVSACGGGSSSGRRFSRSNRMRRRRWRRR